MHFVGTFYFSFFYFRATNIWIWSQTERHTSSFWKSILTFVVCHVAPLWKKYRLTRSENVMLIYKEIWPNNASGPNPHSSVTSGFLCPKWNNLMLLLFQNVYEMLAKFPQRYRDLQYSPSYLNSLWRLLLRKLPSV